MKTLFLTLLLLPLQTLFGQNSEPAIFKKITAVARSFKVNTSAVPDDRLTHAIHELRAVKGGFNINEALAYKIEEDKNKGDISEAEAQRRHIYFESGAGKTALDNAIVWIYRETFTLPEIRKLIRFYKSATGKKYAETYPFLMIKTLKAAEEVSKKISP